jgi:hypothetical protein
VHNALFVSHTIYNYWLDYERAILRHSVFPDQPRLGLQVKIDHRPGNMYELIDRISQGYKGLMTPRARSGTLSPE